MNEPQIAQMGQGIEQEATEETEMSVAESTTFYMRAYLCIDYFLQFMVALEKGQRMEQEFWRVMYSRAHADFRALPQHSSQKVVAGGVA